MDLKIIFRKSVSYHEAIDRLFSQRNNFFFQKQKTDIIHWLDSADPDIRSAQQIEC